MTDLNLNSGEDQHLILRDRNGVARLFLRADERGATIHLSCERGASVELRAEDGLSAINFGTAKHAQAAYVVVTEDRIAIACPSKDCGFIRRYEIDRNTGKLYTDSDE